MSSSPGLPLPGLRWRGLTLQMFLFTILPLSLLLLGIAFASLYLHHDTMRALVGDRDLRSVRAASASLAQEVENRAATLQLFAGQVATSSNTTALFEANRLPGFDGGLALVSADGGMLSGSVPGLANLSPHLPPPSAGVAFSEPVFGDNGAWLILAAAPTVGGERLVGAFSPQSLARPVLSNIASDQSTILLLSRSGEVLYHQGEYSHSGPVAQHPGVAEVLRGESGVNYTRATMEDGSGSNLLHSVNEDEHVVAFSPVAPLGWGLVMEESWTAIASPLLRTTQAAPLLLAPVLVLALVALWFGARQVVQPLQALERRASRLAEGDFQAIRQPVGGISEIQHLQDALVKTAGGLQAAQDALHGYIGTLTAGLENERRSLARELHDDTLQALIALNQQVQLAQLRAGDAAQSQPLQELQARVGQTIINLRRAIGGLRPIYLEDLGLAAALGMLVKEKNRPEGPVVELDIQGSEQRLSPETELAFYRIAQEALNNALSHSDASHVRLILSFAQPGSNYTRLEIQDDGRGFQVTRDRNAFARRGHYGLLGMRERADLVGALFKIETAPGKGTRITITCSTKSTRPVR